MSRHEIPARDPAKHDVVVGWDPPMQTLFAIVYDKAKLDADDRIIKWFGDSWRAIRTVAALRQKLSPYAEISEAASRQLIRDATP